MAKNILCLIITKRTGLVDVCSIRMWPSLREKNDQKVTYFFHEDQNFCLLVKITDGESLVNISTF
jgi:hypothetical protein